MRHVGMKLAAFLAAVAVFAPAADQVGAQPPGPPPGAQPPPPNKLDEHLGEWAKRMGGLVNFHTKFKLTRTEATFQRKSEYVGSVLIMKPTFARLRLDSTQNKADYEAFICNGKALFHYDGLKQTITEYPFNPNPAAGGGNLMLDIVQGMSVQQAKQRFQIDLFKEDPNYVYLDIKPVLGADKQEFLHLRFALFGPNVKPPYVPYMPAQAWVMKPNQDTELWEFSDIQTNIAGIEAKHFQAEQIPGWTMKKAPAPGGPPPGPGGPQPGPGGPPPVPGKM
jgi:TIGR03009 family protein